MTRPTLPHYLAMALAVRCATHPQPQPTATVEELSPLQANETDVITSSSADDSLPGCSADDRILGASVAPAHVAPAHEGAPRSESQDTIYGIDSPSDDLLGGELGAEPDSDDLR